MVFHNRRYFTKQNFEITRDALKIEQKNLFEEKEFEIPLEMIGKTISRETIFNSNLLITGFFFLEFIQRSRSFLVSSVCFFL